MSRAESESLEDLQADIDRTEIRNVIACIADAESCETVADCAENIRQALGHLAIVKTELKDLLNRVGKIQKFQKSQRIN